MQTRNQSTPPPTAEGTDPPAPAGLVTPLTELPAGTTGVVAKIDEDDHAMLIRLKTMGMHVGRGLRVVRRGSRIIVSCGGTRIGLSAQVARHVLITPTP